VHSRREASLKGKFHWDVSLLPNAFAWRKRSNEMTKSNFVRLACAVAIVVFIADSVLAQQRGGTAETDKVQPVNSGANPYRVIRDWAQLTLYKRPWGGSNGVAIDRDGKSVWATDRCSPGIAPGCLGTKANPVHLFDETGKEIRSFGGGMFVWPHGIHVDRDGNVWVTDARVPTTEERTKFPGEDKKGSVVIKFSPDGKVLMTLGTPGVKGDPPDALTEPNDVVTDPSNGDVYVAESHTNVNDPNLVGRISVFDRNGAGRVPHTARNRVRLPGTADRRRPPQSPDSDPDEGGEVSRRMARVRPREWPRDRRERHDLYGRRRIRSEEASRLAQRPSHRQLEGRRGDHLRPPAQNRRARWSRGRRHRHRQRRQSLHG
jgi:hypothetical protein